jgi:hypothetical protein
LAIAATTRPRAASGGVGAWTQLVFHTRLELRAIVHSWVLLALIAFGVFGCIAGLTSLERMYGTPILPVSRAVAEIVAPGGMVVGLFVTWIFSAELVWRERASRIAEIIDSTPAPSLVFFASKIVTLAVVIATVLVSAMATGIAFQLANGITHIELDFYLVELFALHGVSLLLLGTMSIFIHTLVNRKVVGHALFAVVLVGLPALRKVLGISEPLLDLWYVPSVPLSDLNRFGHFLKDALWFEAHWVSIAVLLAVATLLLWRRGVTASFLGRLRRAGQAFTPAAAAVTAVAVIAAAGTGGFIYWNMHILATPESAADVERWHAAYEKQYGALVGLPQPRIVDVEIAVELRPQTRGYSSRGRYLLANRTDAPIDRACRLRSRRAAARLQPFRLQDAHPARAGGAPCAHLRGSRGESRFRQRRDLLTHRLQRHVSLQRAAGALDRRLAGTVPERRGEAAQPRTRAAR